MYWLYLAVSAVCFGLAMDTTLPTWAVLLLLLAALGLLVAWMFGWMASRIGSGSRDEMQLLSPEELRRFREQAEARKAAADNNKS
jgi:hypothetical protein